MNDLSLEVLAQDTARLLLKHNLKIVLAESCTGGGLAYTLTEIAGSSAWFERGMVVYSNQAKTDMLGVSANLIEDHGAVSEAVARAMAQGALAHSHAQVAISITGVAGPGGGSAAKPVGTVFIGCKTPIQETVQHHVFAGTRHAVRQAAMVAALNEINRQLNQSTVKSIKLV